MLHALEISSTFRIINFKLNNNEDVEFREGHALVDFPAAGFYAMRRLSRPIELSYHLRNPEYYYDVISS